MNFLRKMSKPKFDYKAFENGVFDAVLSKMKELDKKDTYALSIDYFPDFTTSVDIWTNSFSHLNKHKEEIEEDPSMRFYYKCCEEEWEEVSNIEEPSVALQKFYKALEDWAGEDDDLLENTRGEHEKAVKEICINVLQKIKQTAEFAEFPELNLNLHMREKLSEEEQLEIYKKLNSEKAVEEFQKFLYGE